MLAEAAAAMGSLKSATDIVQALIATRDANKFNAQLAQTLDALVSARLQTLELVEAHEKLISQNRELQRKLDAKEQWSEESKDFELTEISRGMYAYLRKGNSLPLKQAQKFCVNCFDDKQSKSILQLQVVNPGRRNVLFCHQCNRQLELFHQAFIDEHTAPPSSVGSIPISRS
jgi:hypothetical protein